MSSCGSQWNFERAKRLEAECDPLRVLQKILQESDASAETVFYLER